MRARSGIDGFAVDLERDAAVMRGRVPAYERLDGLVGAALAGDLGRALDAAWAARTFHAWYDRPRLLLAALRFDALAEGPSHPLWRALAAPSPDAGVVDRDALAAATDPARERFWTAVRERHVQTNETSRAVAWLWPARLAGADAAAGGTRSLVLADLGCSAGLNLVADRLEPPWTDGEGRPLAVARAPRVLARLGLDARPLDPLREDDANWLRACVWPGERAREARLEAALAAFAAARDGPGAPRVETAIAEDMPGRVAVLAAAHQDALLLAYQSTFRDYLDAAARAAYEGGMRALLLARPPGAALWIESEHATDGTAERPAELVVSARAGDRVVRRRLARCGFHPSTIWVEPDATSGW